MKDLKLYERWSSLPLREKRALTFGGMVTILLLAYALIWSPISNQAAILRNRIEQDKKLLSWMQSANTHIQSLQQSLHPSISTSSKSILSILQNEIKQSNFTKNLSALRQVDPHSVQINFQNVSFDTLITWLTQLSTTKGLQVTQMSVTPSTTQGLVTTEIILKG